MYWLSINIFDAMIVHIQDVETPKDAWDTLSKLYNMQAWKMQIKHDLHNVKRENMNINDHFMMVKKLANLHTSNSVPIKDMAWYL